MVSNALKKLPTFLQVEWTCWIPTPIRWHSMLALLSLNKIICIGGWCNQVLHFFQFVKMHLEGYIPHPN